MSVAARPVPEDALLQRYVAQAGCYTDCFVAQVPGSVDLGSFIAAFYTTWLFRLERAVLSVTLRRRIKDADVHALADGAAAFAAWRVEARAADQILLCDLSGATRSFLAVQDAPSGGTALLFGSAVVPGGGQSTLGRRFRVLLPAHRVYSRALLALAARNLAGSAA